MNIPRCIYTNRLIYFCRVIRCRIRYYEPF